MDRPFTEKDNEKKFKCETQGYSVIGKLEYPLTDPPDITEYGILWLDKTVNLINEDGLIEHADWFYVFPQDVEEIK